MHPIHKHCIYRYHYKFLIFFAIYFSRNVFRTKNQRSSGTKCPIPTDVHNSGKRAGGSEGPHPEREEEEEEEEEDVGILNMGRRFGGPLKQSVDLTSSSKEGENQERQTREEDPNPEVSDNDTDYNDEKYPPTEDRYKQWKIV